MADIAVTAALGQPRLRWPRLHPVIAPARATVALPIFNFAASNRNDQCATPSFFGGRSKVAAIAW